MRPAKTQISLGIRPVWSILCIRPVWSESSLSAWRKLVSAHWVHSEDSYQTGQSSLGAQSFCWFCHAAVQIVDKFIQQIAHFNLQTQHIWAWRSSPRWLKWCEARVLFFCLPSAQVTSILEASWCRQTRNCQILCSLCISETEVIPGEYYFV